MPIQIGQDLHLPTPPTADLVPDINVDIPFPVFISQETLLQFPGKMVNGQVVLDFSSFTPEQIQLFEDKYRFGGIRLRSDIRDRTIPLTRETVDLP